MVSFGLSTPLSTIFPKQEGRILRFDKLSDSFLPLQEKELREYFISHLSIGHHAELALNYESRRKDHNRSVVNKLIFGV